MDPTTLIPSPDPIPAPSWIFMVLNVFTFILHLLLMNIILGGSLILLFYRFKDTGSELQNSFGGSLVGKLPTSYALTINLGVAPLLFLQVLYGHLFYTSSVLMAVYWILVVPLLIVAYYGAYIHQKKFAQRSLSILVLLISTLILLYIAFVFVNNMTLMVHPENWTGYFENRGGTLLNWEDPTLWPRYLHFVVAAVAVAGLFMALIFWLREKNGQPDSEANVRAGLKIFAIATALQIIIGFWFLLALPQNIMLQFMGKNLAATIFLFAGVIFGIGAMVLAFMNKFLPTLIHLLATLILMAISRAFLRSMYLADYFQLKELQLAPQYDVLILFLVTFIIGLVAVYYMLKVGLGLKMRRAEA